MSSLPEAPGIYQYFDNQGTIIYIGKAKNLKKRITSYFTKEPENRKTALLVRNIANIQHMVVDSEEDALLLENNLIKKYQPRYNIRLKDDKTYPWICIKNEPFPRVFKTRNVIRDGSDYYGPFTSWLTVSTLLDLFKKLYKLRSCNYNLSRSNIDNGKFKVCLEYHIGNCKGPCENHQADLDYKKGIDEIKDILKGNVGGVIQQLRVLMQGHADNFRFEEAHEIKERLLSLENYQSRSTIVSPNISDVDVFTISSDENLAIVNYLKIIRGAIVQTHTMEIKKLLDEPDEDLIMMAIVDIRQKIYSNAREILMQFKPSVGLQNCVITAPKIGEKRKLVELSLRNATYYRMDKKRQEILHHEKETPTQRMLSTVQSDLQLSALPVYIECFDNSNLQGSFPVAACVVFRDGRPAKRDYRHYNIKTVEGPNDFASMEEVVFRRYRRLLDEQSPLPQLIVIDGGKGQLSAAASALESLNLRGKIAIIGIAKRLEEIFFPEDSVPIYLDKRSVTLKLIQSLRDEAHRFGISFHRQKRSKGFLKNELEEIKGIGPATIKKLLLQYKSVKRISLLSKEEMVAVVGEDKALKLVDFFINREKMI